MKDVGNLRALCQAKSALKCVELSKAETRTKQNYAEIIIGFVHVNTDGPICQIWKIIAKWIQMVWYLDKQLEVHHLEGF